MPSSRLARAVLAGLAILAASPSARADLDADAERVARLWTARGARVERLPAVFLDHGRSRAIHIPPSAPSVGADPRCLTVALLAVRTAELIAGPAETASQALDHGRLFGLEARRDPGHRIHSAAGALSLSRCDEARSDLARLHLEIASSRAAVEVLVARSSDPLPALSELLPERARAPVAPRGDAGGPLTPGPLVERLARAERRARGEGAVEVTRSTTRAQPSGGGQAVLKVAEGCHRIEVMAEVPPGARRITDVDAEARGEGGRLLARDRAEVPDARLDFCVGEAENVSIAFAGAAGAVAVTLLDARWPIPVNVPARFGPRARAGLSAALARRHAPAPPAPAIFTSLGAQGTTSIPVEVQPGRCYLVAMALVRGEARSMRLSAIVGDRTMRDDVQHERSEGAALAFCAENESVVRFEAEARGSAPWWALSMWAMGAASL